MKQTMYEGRLGYCERGVLVQKIFSLSPGTLSYILILGYFRVE